jgi:bile acid:Na+ symporter, BASS family
MNNLYIVLPVLGILMFTLGLELRLADFTALAKKPKPVSVGLFGQIVILPVAAIIIAFFMEMPLEFKIGLVLIAACPGGITSNTFTMLAGGNTALSVVLTSITSFLSVVSLPLVLYLASVIFSAEYAGISLPFMKIVTQSFMMVYIPIILGMLLRKIAPKKAAALAGLLRKISLPLLLLVVAAFIYRELAVIISCIRELFTAVLLLSVLSMAAGGLLSAVWGLAARERKTIVIEVGMQNAAQAITIASSPFLLNNASIALPAVIYVVLMNAAVISYVFIPKLGRKA